MFFFTFDYMFRPSRCNIVMVIMPLEPRFSIDVVTVIIVCNNCMACSYTWFSVQFRPPTTQKAVTVAAVLQTFGLPKILCVVTLMLMQIAVSCNMIPCRTIRINQSFRDAYCFPLVCLECHRTAGLFIPTVAA
jgi:hypothetical protein